MRDNHQLRDYFKIHSGTHPVTPILIILKRQNHQPQEDSISDIERQRLTFNIHTYIRSFIRTKLLLYIPLYCAHAHIHLRLIELVLNSTRGRAAVAKFERDRPFPPRIYIYIYSHMPGGNISATARRRLDYEFI